MRKDAIKSLALKAAVAGIFAGTVMTPGCGKDSAKSEQNSCSGPNGCNGKGTKGLEQNNCSGPNGCNGHGTKGLEEKNH